MNAAFNVDYFVSLDDTDDRKDIPPMGYSFVTSNLAQGSAPPPDASMPFDVLVLTAQEYQPAQSMFFKNIHVIHVPLDDSIPSRDEVRRAIIAARLLAVHLKRGQRVLTTCFMGRNRSGLVNGLVLIELGWTSFDAITAIKQARGDDALSNVHFKQVLHAHARSLGRGSQVELT